MRNTSGNYSRTTENAVIAKLLAERHKRRSLRKNIAEQYRTDPWGFWKDFYGIDESKLRWSLMKEYDDWRWDGTPDPLAQVVDNVQNQEWSAVVSAKGIGKTFLGAMLLVWFLSVYEDSIVVTVAPKGDQLKLHLWKEVGTLYRKHPIGELQSLKLKMRSGIDSWYAVGFIAGVAHDENTASRAGGFHAEHMLVILEEAAGIDDAIINAFVTTCVAPNNVVVAFGNPKSKLDNLNRFADRKNVRRIQVSALDHPNVVKANPSFIPGAQTVQGIQMMKDYYRSVDSPFYRANVQGITPEQTEDALISYEWLTAAAENKAIGEELSAGFDPAASEDGDPAGECIMQGNVVQVCLEAPCPDPVQYGVKIKGLMSKLGIKASRVGVDAVSVGAGTVGKLKELKLNVYAIKGSTAPMKRKEKSLSEYEFNNLRSQMYWQLSLDLHYGEIVLDLDAPGIVKYREKLEEELLSITVEVKGDKITIISKEELKKKLGRSPNLADSLVMCNWVRRLKKKSTAITSNKLLQNKDYEA